MGDSAVSTWSGLGLGLGLGLGGLLAGAREHLLQPREELRGHPCVEELLAAPRALGLGQDLVLRADERAGQLGAWLGFGVGLGLGMGSGLGLGSGLGI